MKFKSDKIVAETNILANSHFVAINYDCSEVSASDGVVKAGTLVENVGVVLNDVVLAENPNGTVIIHGFVSKSKLPEKPDDESKYPMIKFL
ncbi:MAG: hypothetical protein ACLT5F_09130 [Anaerotignaceae bacterium]